VWEFDVQDGMPFFPLFWVDILVEAVGSVFPLADKADLWNSVCADQGVIGAK
jgi:hypothetical protein